MAGIIANVEHESGGNPLAIGDNGNAVGLFQWNGPRAHALMDWSQENGLDPRDANTQMQFLTHELERDYPGLIEKMNNAPSAAEAAKIFMNEFERPADRTQDRGTAAEAALDWMKRTALNIVGSEPFRKAEPGETSIGGYAVYPKSVAEGVSEVGEGLADVGGKVLAGLTVAGVPIAGTGLAGEIVAAVRGYKTAREVTKLLEEYATKSKAGENPKFVVQGKEISKEELAGKIAEAGKIAKDASDWAKNASTISDWRKILGGVDDAAAEHFAKQIGVKYSGKENLAKDIVERIKKPEVGGFNSWAGSLALDYVFTQGFASGGQAFIKIVRWMIANARQSRAAKVVSESAKAAASPKVE